MAREVTDPRGDLFDNLLLSGHVVKLPFKCYVSIRRAGLLSALGGAPSSCGGKWLTEKLRPSETAGDERLGVLSHSWDISTKPPPQGSASNMEEGVRRRGELEMEGRLRMLSFGQ